MKDHRGRIIYVGKARDLKKRVASYFRPARQLDMKTGILMKKVTDFDTIITAGEHDALLLESALIKEHRPRYNILLKDDKAYPLLRLDLREPYPAIRVTRRAKADGALYFGPYTAPGAMRRTLKILNRAFHLRKCSNSVFRTRTRSCLNHQIGGCLAPCCLAVPEAVYRKMVDEAVLFLRGRTADLVDAIRAEMMDAAGAREFEKAAQLRDRMFALETVLEKQVAVVRDQVDRDIIGIARSDPAALVVVLTVRGGAVAGSRSFFFREALLSDRELVESFIQQYYPPPAVIPREILTPELPEHLDALEDCLTKWRGRRVHILHPRRGDKMRLMEMARENAGDLLRRRLSSRDHQRSVMELLRDRLRLPDTPRRIECVDNSHTQGTCPVSGLVVYGESGFLKSGYRKYILRTLEQPDDYAGMREVLSRRFRRAAAPHVRERPGGPESGKSFDPEPVLPDLLLVDGGKGQLNIALAVLAELGLESLVPVAGIAKKDEAAGDETDKIYLPGRSNPVNWGRRKEGLFLLMKIRDEAHRFALSFHRKRRGKAATSSVLDQIPGIGPKRKKNLLTHFGSIGKLKNADAAELAKIPGISLALAGQIVLFLKEGGGESSDS